jgi:membrane fusion protein (multidrug efflux system)
LSETEYLHVADQINRPTPGRGLWRAGTALTLALADGTTYPLNGTFLAADREIDPRTGTIRISAAFPNPNHLLRPGQYGRVTARTAVMTSALLVPQRAVTDLQGKSQVRTVGQDNKMTVQTVTLGGRVGSRWIVQKGLDAGARVIVDATTVAAGTVVKPTIAAPATQAEN